MDLREYWQALQHNVCEKCVDGDGKGNCRLNASVACALEQHLPLIIEAVSRVSSREVSDYLGDLRGIVCAQCQHQSVNGHCILRSEVDCSLDRYFPLVIETIEQVKQRHHLV